MLNPDEEQEGEGDFYYNENEVGAATGERLEGMMDLSQLQDSLPHDVPPTYPPGSLPSLLLRPASSPSCRFHSSHTHTHTRTRTHRAMAKSSLKMAKRAAWKMARSERTHQSSSHHPTTTTAHLPARGCSFIEEKTKKNRFHFFGFYIGGRRR
jgi:hypothetical protein